MCKLLIPRNIIWLDTHDIILLLGSKNVYIHWNKQNICEKFCIQLWNLLLFVPMYWMCCFMNRLIRVLTGYFLLLLCCSIALRNSFDAFTGGFSEPSILTVLILFVISLDKLAYRPAMGLQDDIIEEWIFHYRVRRWNVLSDSWLEYLLSIGKYFPRNNSSCCYLSCLLLWAGCFLRSN